MHNREATFMQKLAQSTDTTRSLAANLSIYDRMVRQHQLDPIGNIAMTAYDNLIEQYANMPHLNSHNPQNQELKTQHTNRLPAEFSTNSLVSGMKTTTLTKAFSKSPHLTKINKANTNSNEILIFDKLQIVSGDYDRNARLLRHQILSKKFRQFLNLTQKYKQQVRSESKNHSARLYHHSQLYNKVFSAFRAELSDIHIYQATVEEFMGKRNEVTLEDYFLAWKERIYMSAEQRQRERQIQAKYYHLTSALFIGSLRTIHANKSQPSLLFDRTDNFAGEKQQIRLLKRRRFYQLMVRFKSQRNRFKGLESTLHSMLKERQISIFLKCAKAKNFLLANYERKSIVKIQRTLNGQKLIRSLSFEYELQSIYWKNKQKIIFLSMLFNAVKVELTRQGYSFEWMQQVEPAFRRIDCKLGGVILLHHKRMVFDSLKGYIQRQKTNSTAVKSLYVKKTFKNLHVFCIECHETKSLNQKSELVSKMYIRMATRQALGQIFANSSFGVHHQTRKVKSSYQMHLKKVGLNSLLSHKESVKSSRSSLKHFKLKTGKSLVSRVFYACKEVLLTEVINRRILTEYSQYREKVHLGHIFRGFSRICFEQRLLKKKISNLNKLRMNYFGDRFIFSLKKNSIYQPKLIEQCLHDVIKLKRSRQFESLLSRCREAVLAKIIGEQLGVQHQRRIKWRIFHCLKSISSTSKLHASYSRQIQANSAQRTKKTILAIFVEKLLVTMLLKQAAVISERLLLRSVWKSIAG